LKWAGQKDSDCRVSLRGSRESPKVDPDFFRYVSSKWQVEWHVHYLEGRRYSAAGIEFPRYPDRFLELAARGSNRKERVSKLFTSK
jgi:hypothetical protein